MKALKSLTVCVALFIAIGSIFYSPSQSFSQALPLCSSLANGVTADPGVNCLYYNLPICTSTLNATATVSPVNHRVNCFDLADMPLCTDVTSSGNTALSTKNCALTQYCLPSSHATHEYLDELQRKCRRSVYILSISIWRRMWKNCAF